MTNAVPLAFTQLGEEHSSSLYILHGLYGSSSNWRSVARTLSSQYHVVVSDARNHGESKWSDRMDYEAMADDLSKLVSDTAHDRVIVVGHSMGGKTAMTFALRQSIDLHKLVIVDIAPVSYLGLQAGEDHPQLIRTMRELDPATVTNRQDADEALATAISNPGIRQFLLQNLKKNAGSEGYYWRLNLDAVDHALTSLMDWPDDSQSQSTTVPTLFIRGATSSYVDPSKTQSIDSLFPTNMIKTVDNAGHWVHAEQPAAFIDMVQSFLGS